MSGKKRAIERKKQIKNRIWRPRIFDNFFDIKCFMATKQFGNGWRNFIKSDRFTEKNSNFILDKILIRFAKLIDSNFDAREIIYPELAHTNNIVEVDDEIVENYKKSKKRILNADGIITKRANTILMIFVADCLPIGVYDPKNKAIGVFHSGWLGTAQNIVGLGIEKMQRSFSANPEDLYVAVGPGYSDNYEVQEDVLKKFRESGVFSEQEIAEIFTKTDETHYHLDLYKAIEMELLKAGVKKENIEITSLHTDLDNDILPSHRKERGQADRAPFAMYLKK